MGKKVKKESEPPSKDVFDPLPIESKKAATVVLMLNSPEEEVLAKACEAIHKFAEKDKLVRRNAFMALGVMAANSDVKRLLKKLNVIPSVIGKLSPEEDVVVHEFATLCLASLSVDFSCKVQISDQEGLEPLIQLLSSPDPDLLRSEFPVIQQLSLRTLVIITTDTDTRATFREEQGFDRLLEFLCNKEFSDLHVEALQLVSNCLEDRDSLQLIQETGAENRKLLHEQDIERSLVELLSLEDDSVRTATCQAIAAMSLHLASKDSFRALDGIRAVVQLLGGEGAVLTNMAEQEVLRCSILSHGAMAALLEPLQSADTHTLVRATQAVAALACDAEGRADLRNAGGLVPLVQLLRSNHKEVRRNACWAISVCANDEPTAVEMCKLGVSVDQSEERQQDSPTETRTASVLSSKGTTRTPSKGRSKGRREDDKLRDEDESKPQQEVATVTEKPWMLPYDATFHALVTKATKTILPLLAESEQYSALARLVSEVMGGAVEVDRQHDFLWELHLSELRYELQSNIIPIGQIRKGTYYHRALLYKVLADRIGVSCSLVRGEYNRAWNEVLLSVGTPHYPRCQPQPRAHLVDLIQQPGRLLRANTPQAIQYQTI
ncbi:unnamed protein product [Coregonus sp. 'balchen']|nr:unnamed protein product [Coregonus sp. 'balchen']